MLQPESMRPLLLCLLLSLPVAAQRKLWTWTPPGQDANTAFYVLAHASAANGPTAIVYAAPLFAGGALQSMSFKVALISATGQTIKVEDVPGVSRWGIEEYFQVTGRGRWQIPLVSKSKVVATDGDRVLTFSIKGKTASLAWSQVSIDEQASVASDGLRLPCLLKQQRQYVGLIQWTFGPNPVIGNASTEFNHTDTVELWSLK